MPVPIKLPSMLSIFNLSAIERGNLSLIKVRKSSIKYSGLNRKMNTIIPVKEMNSRNNRKNQLATVLIFLMRV